ncbi:Uncharacterized protein FKW44_004670 [Caligus rogercresseyi]|uniref:Uncharacterized protein n=1 Tax=Caligus rogercresseyi TaxID=217165 RepID=A0A7T8HLW8_CALRO|nr:Uncharacterized protein FKW44_004670 [Caligus rogercresseyi]
MVQGVMSSDGKKMPPYFFKPGEKVDNAAYYKVLRWTVLPWLRTTHPDGNYTWNQDAIRPRRSWNSAAPTCPTSGRPTWGLAQAQT